MIDVQGERALVLAVALIADRYIIDPAWLWRRLPHPVVGFGATISAVERAFVGRSDRAERFGGLLLVLILLAVCGLVATAVHAVDPLGVIEIALVSVLLAQRSLLQHVRAVGEGLDRSIGQGRSAVAMIVGRTTQDMAETEVATAAIESLAENQSDGVVAPAFWYLVLGPFGILAYKAVNTADSMVGHLTERHARFGWASARLDDLLNFVPARVTALLFLLLGGCLRDVREMARDAATHCSPNAGWPEAALARACELRLGGPRRYGDAVVDAPFLNPNGSVPERSDIGRALHLVQRSFLVLLLASLVMGAARLGEVLQQIAIRIG